MKSTQVLQKLGGQTQPTKIKMQVNTRAGSVTKLTTNKEPSDVKRASMVNIRDHLDVELSPRNAKRSEFHEVLERTLRTSQAMTKPLAVRKLSATKVIDTPKNQVAVTNQKNKVRLPPKHTGPIHASTGQIP